MTVPLSSCGGGIASSINLPANAAFRIDSSISSKNQDSRVRTLVFHYTAQPLDMSLKMLTEAQYQVSAHYLVPDGQQIFNVYQLVPETARAWHTGVSYWQGDRMLNSSTIGIEIVNLGFPTQDESAPLMSRRWYPFPDTQIAVVAQLARDIIARHQIRPYKIVGHSDIALGRKFDPGPLFPWEKLFTQYQIGAWPDAEAVSYYANSKPFNGNVADLQSKLLTYGYDASQSGTLDKHTVDAVTAFQMHFRSSRYDGIPDVETVAILDALLEKYFNKGRAQKLHGQIQSREQKPDIEEMGSDVWPLLER